jgi:hypothetical protein
LFLSLVADPEHAVPVEIVHHRDVLGSLAERRLVDSDATRPLLLSSSQSPTNGPVLDAGDLIPAERKLTGHRREARFLQPVDDEGFEEETYQSYLRFFSAWVSTPGGAAWWREISALYTPRMVAAVDGKRMIYAGFLPVVELEE